MDERFFSQSQNEQNTNCHTIDKTVQYSQDINKYQQQSQSSEQLYPNLSQYEIRQSQQNSQQSSLSLFAIPQKNRELLYDNIQLNSQEKILMRQCQDIVTQNKFLAEPFSNCVDHCKNMTSTINKKKFAFAIKKYQFKESVIKILMICMLYDQDIYEFVVEFLDLEQLEFFAVDSIKYYDAEITKNFLESKSIKQLVSCFVQPFLERVLENKKIRAVKFITRNLLKGMSDLNKKYDQIDQNKEQMIKQIGKTYYVYLNYRKLVEYQKEYNKALDYYNKNIQMMKKNLRHSECLKPYCNCKF